VKAIRDLAGNFPPQTLAKTCWVKSVAQLEDQSITMTFWIRPDFASK